VRGQSGGKWVLTMKNSPALLDWCWNWLMMGLVGEELEDGNEICAVVGLRTKVDHDIGLEFQVFVNDSKQ